MIRDICGNDRLFRPSGALGSLLNLSPRLTPWAKIQRPSRAEDGAFGSARRPYPPAPSTIWQSLGLSFAPVRSWYLRVIWSMNLSA